MILSRNIKILRHENGTRLYRKKHGKNTAGQTEKQLKQKSNNYFCKQHTSTGNTGLKFTQKFTRSQ